MEEDRQDFRPLDAPEEDADNTTPPIGKNLLKVAEDEMEFLTGFEMKGFPQDGTTQKGMDGVASSG